MRHSKRYSIDKCVALNVGALKGEIHVQDAGQVGSVRFSDWTKHRAVATLGSNQGSTTLAFQNWRRFKEAFAPELVARAIDETAGRVAHVADPFGGSGTTALAAQFLGVHSTTI
jgi:hypothetical protein